MSAMWSWNEVLANSMERAEREGLTDGVERAKGGGCLEDQVLRSIAY